MSFLLLSWFRASVVSACFFMVNTFLPTEEIWHEDAILIERDSGVGQGCA